MTTRFRPSRPVRFVAVTAAALGLGVPAALALSDAPERPRLEEPVVRSASSDDDDEATTTTTSTTVEDAGDDAVDDISGPCDEAEHADDPECTGVTPASTVVDDDDGDDDDDHGDRSGSGHGGDDHGGDEDRSGSNSGPG